MFLQVSTYLNSVASFSLLRRQGQISLQFVSCSSHQLEFVGMFRMTVQVFHTFRGLPAFYLRKSLDSFSRSFPVLCMLMIELNISQISSLPWNLWSTRKTRDILIKCLLRHATCILAAVFLSLKQNLIANSVRNTLQHLWQLNTPTLKKLARMVAKLYSKKHLVASVNSVLPILFDDHINY